MTIRDTSKPEDNVDLIDRIVDGELNPAELRAAMKQLEQMPDGWKRCTLAFLEAQCWRDSIPPMDGSERLLARLGPVPRPVASAGSAWRRPWLRGSIAAAIALASFSLGWLGRAARVSLPVEHEMIAAAAAPTSAAALEGDAAPPIRPVSHDAGDERFLETSYDVPRPVMRLLIDSDRGNADVPILAGPGIDDDWIKRQPPPVSEHRQAVLEQRGYQVDQRRQLLTTTLADGRRVAVPIDQVQIRYTGPNPL
jgi:hypothetical protein